MDNLRYLIEQLQSNGQQATIVFYIGHYNDDGEDVIDAAIYDGHPAITATTQAEAINYIDIDDILGELILKEQSG